MSLEKAITVSGLKEFHLCPFCEYKGEIPLVRRRYWTGNRKGFWYKYECPECKEAFTTEESDTLSLETLKKKTGLTT